MNRLLASFAALLVGGSLFAQDAPKGEALPALPKADAKSVLTPLQPDKSLYLETKPDKSRRILVEAEVCLREGPLEVFLTKKGTKEHEAILKIATDARFIHASLDAIGAKVGTPVQYVNPKTMEDDFKPATGQKIKVSVCYNSKGKTLTHPAQEWVMNTKTKKEMTEDWVFAGGKFVKNPDNPDAPPYYSANGGSVFTLSNDFDSLLDLPVQVSRDDATLIYRANTEKIPPLTSKVWVILEPEAEKKK